MKLGVVVVTGGASGLGRSLALGAAGRGADVAIADLSADRLASVADEIRAAGRRAVTMVCDVREPEAHVALRDLAARELGPIDLWCNNAGVAVAARVGEGPLDDWRWLIDINLMGVVYGCQAIVPYLRARGTGAVLNTASAAGLVSSPNMGAYNASKAAVVALTETLSTELGGSGVTATVLCPTFFQTNLLETARAADTSNLRFASKLMQRSRWTSDDVARVALDDAQAGRLYSVPMSDGLWMWRARRLAPSLFYRRLASVVEAAQRRLDPGSAKR